MSGAKPFRDDLGWRWETFAGRWVLVTDGGGQQVIISGAHQSHLQTRDPGTGLLRPISPSDHVAKIIAAAPDVRRQAQSLIHGIDIGLFRIEADGDEAIANDVLTKLRIALGISGAA
jgi:hypothetical protein